VRSGQSESVDLERGVVGDEYFVGLSADGVTTENASEVAQNVRQRIASAFLTPASPEDPDQAVARGAAARAQGEPGEDGELPRPGSE